MRAFLVMCCMTLATADKLGYNYKPVAHSDGGLSFNPGISSCSFASAPYGDKRGIKGSLDGGLVGLNTSLPSVLASTRGLNSGSSDNLDSSSDGTSSSSDSNSSSASDSSSSLGNRSSDEESYEKEFFTFTAKESDFNKPETNDQALNSVKKSLRVIFIKGPENNALENGVINLVKHASKQKTAIYVLQKQSTLGELANQLQASHDLQNRKPIVHFVKYRTPEDAVDEQRAIQSQYDHLPGSSQSHDGGAAPVHNFASPAIVGPGSRVSDNVGGEERVSVGVGPIGSISGVLSITAPRTTYLPAAILRTLRI